MSRTHLPTLLAIIASVSLGAAPALAQPVREDGKATVTMVSPMSIVKIRDLDFGTIYMDATSTGGTVVIDPTRPEGSEISVTGAILSGNDGHSAKFGGSPERTKKIKIRIPKGTITMTRLGGTETLVVRNFTLDGPDQRTVTASTYFDFRVGASIDIPAGAAEGAYEGQFEVQVQYP
ncbi:DUF4402 domain-containing protein [Sphingomicrobium lutaoense]|uniref:DUF4402 domain-containing protein n=1 Tax=Sphingomicrobium lutaoense TaxID=515949 RepID=A0A839Z282_9SPHN|nr:DUF4402 domain-containing protein [Sphingomicrobium lutaoense]MBB3764750.1 hypothetical protein [Sphingomicrobium lutaoense]